MKMCPNSVLLHLLKYAVYAVCIVCVLRITVFVVLSSHPIQTFVFVHYKCDLATQKCVDPKDVVVMIKTK